MTWTLQLHFSLPCKQPCQGPRLLADWEHILSSPIVSGNPAPCRNQDIQLDMTFFLDQGGSKVLVSLNHEHTFGRAEWTAQWGEVPCAHHPCTGHLGLSISQITQLASSYPVRGALYYLASWLVLTLNLLLSQLLKVYFKVESPYPYFSHSCSREYPILQFSRYTVLIHISKDENAFFLELISKEF